MENQFIQNILSFIGRLHPLLVHFPVSLLIVATVLRFWKNELRIVKILVTIGAGSALIAAITGLLLMWQDELTGEAIELHRNSGIFLGICSFGLLYLIFAHKQNTKAFDFLLIGTGIFTAITGHLGGNITHGEGYLTNFSEPKALSNISYFENLTEADQVRLLTDVRSIFAHNCYKCHSSTKVKGELRLDEKELVFAGGEGGEIIEPFKPESSELYRRITLPADHKESMPSKGKTLKKEEIEVIRFWIEQGAPWPEGSEVQSLFPRAALAPRKPSLPNNQFSNPIDAWVDEYFSENNLSWKPEANDHTFIRRAYLDIVGLTPSFNEVVAFTEDPSPDKRERLIEELLNRNHDYTQHWISFWNDALRNDYSGTGYITKGRYNINHWLYNALLKNKPYDQFVAELLNPTEESKGFISGIKWRGTVNASQRTEMQAAQNVGQVFLGVNVKCASCHDSFVSDWKLEEAYAFANIFAEEQLEIAECEKPTGEYAGTQLLFPELGTIDSTLNRDQKLELLAKYLVKEENGRFYRTIVNRVWAQLMGRGIIGTVDEMDNKAWSQNLLDWMAVNFVENGKDLKKLIYLILTSDIYQMQRTPLTEPNSLFKDDYIFKGPLIKKLTAEQYADVISKSIAPLYSKDEMAFEPKVENGFIKVDVAGSRASMVKLDPFQKALGRPNREIVSTSRTLEASMLQALELTNGQKLDNALSKGAKKLLNQYSPSVDDLVTHVYQEMLCRNPSEEELNISKRVLGHTPSPEQVQDMLWSISMLPEFQLIQ